MSKQTGIALFVYNRPQHLQQVLEGLRANKISHLYIFADAARSDTVKPAVDEVRKLIHSIDWCQTSIIEQTTNLGLDNSIRFGIDHVFQRHDRVIVLEDDCVPMPSFLSYMEACFNFYQDKPSVMSVNACSPPFSVPKSVPGDAYFAGRIFSWGWGTWKDRWAQYNGDKDLYLMAKPGTAIRKKIDAVGLDLIRLLECNYNGLDDNWDIFWATTVILKDGLCVTPKKSHIKQIGLDGTGMHNLNTDFFDSHRLCTEKNEEFELPKDLWILPEIQKRYLWMSYGRKHGLALHLATKLASLGIRAVRKGRRIVLGV